MSNGKKKLETDKQIESTELATRPAPEGAGAIAVTDRGVNLTNIDDMFRFAQALWQSGLVPDSYKNEQSVLVAIEMGMEFGMYPMAAVRGIAVINGMPALWGNALLGVVQNSGKMEWIKENIIGEDDNRIAVCASKRFDSDLIKRTEFSVSDAKRAGLWLGENKKNPKLSPWYKYPERMLAHRARGFNLNDNFADVLSGCVSAEEAMDMQQEREAFDPNKAAGAVDQAESLADELQLEHSTQKPANIIEQAHEAIDADPGETITIAPAHIKCNNCDGEGKVYSPNTGKLIGDCYPCNGTGKIDPNETRDEREERTAQEDADVAARDEDLLRSYNQRKAEGDQADANREADRAAEIAALTEEANAEQDEHYPDRESSDPTGDSSNPSTDTEIKIDEAELIQIDQRFEKLVVRFANEYETSMDEANDLVLKWLRDMHFEKNDLKDPQRWLNIWTAAKKIKITAATS